ncbi:hypothetical protein ACQ4LD_21060, partial [Sphingobacterium daejeonense]
LAQTIRTFQLPHTKVSSHYVIGRDGRVVQMLRLVPERVTADIPPPANPPALTSKGAIWTVISSIASNEIGETPVLEPFVPAPVSYT